MLILVGTKWGQKFDCITYNPTRVRARRHHDSRNAEKAVMTVLDCEGLNQCAFTQEGTSFSSPTRPVHRLYLSAAAGAACLPLVSDLCRTLGSYMGAAWTDAWPYAMRQLNTTAAGRSTCREVQVPSLYFLRHAKRALSEVKSNAHR